MNEQETFRFEDSHDLASSPVTASPAKRADERDFPDRAECHFG